MLEYLNFCLLCVLFTLIFYLYFRTKKYFTLLKMAEEIFISYNPLQLDSKRQKLLECILTGNSKLYLGKVYTEDQKSVNLNLKGLCLTNRYLFFILLGKFRWWILRETRKKKESYDTNHILCGACVPSTSLLFLVRFDEYTLKPYCMKSITALLGENVEAGAVPSCFLHKQVNTHTNADLGSLNGHSRPV